MLCFEPFEFRFPCLSENGLKEMPQALGKLEVFAP
ncbi:hypothetical protein PSE_0874 [Pseudovibrio sp. FO-BEG1]|nr:hypothetical protein PSE_0874 [Pseudovibrio sp. FO-BEG1]